MLGHNILPGSFSNPGSQRLTIMMKYNRPETFVNRKIYFHRDKSRIDIHQGSSLVIFLSYTACPAFVIIQDETGRKIRCQRDDLFEFKEIPTPHRLDTLIDWIIQVPGLFRSYFSYLNFSTVRKTLDYSKAYFK